MDLLNTILNSQDGNVVAQIANQLGIDRSDVENVIGQVAPALGRGLANNAQSPNGLGALVGALQSGDHQRYLDSPALAVKDDGVNEGNKILGHIFGGKEVSRQLAGRASEQTGVSDSLIKKMLPMLATVAMGALSNQKSQSSESGGALGGILGAFLGGGADGSIADDLIGIAGKIFGR